MTNGDQLLSLLSENGPNLDQLDIHKRTALHYAAENVGSVDNFSKLIQTCSEQLDLQDEDFYTPLMIAAEHNNVPFLEDAFEVLKAAWALEDLHRCLVVAAYAGIVK